MASVKDTASFFANGSSKQFEYCLKLYPQVLKLKAEKRCKKPEELIRLDDWYQNELPKMIKQRGKDAHLVHEELVQTMKWKQSRGRFYPQLNYLVKVNTPRAVIQETKKAFKKLPNIEQAITALSNLKGVGTTMASALLAAAAPETAPFMADECLMAIPEIEGIEYTAKEYLNFVQHIQNTVTRLNSEKDSNNASWSAHRVELALWAHFVASDLKPELLDELPNGVTYNQANGTITNSSHYEEKTTTTTTTTTDSDPENPIEHNSDSESNLEPAVVGVVTTNGKNGIGVIDSLDEDDDDVDDDDDDDVDEEESTTRSEEDSLEKPITPIVANDETNDSDSLSSAKRSMDCESSNGEHTENSQPEKKRLKTSNTTSTKTETETATATATLTPTATPTTESSELLN